MKDLLTKKIVQCLDKSSVDLDGLTATDAKECGIDNATRSNAISLYVENASYGTFNDNRLISAGFSSKDVQMLRSVDWQSALSSRVNFLGGVSGDKKRQAVDTLRQIAGKTKRFNDSCKDQPEGQQMATMTVQLVVNENKQLVAEQTQPKRDAGRKIPDCWDNNRTQDDPCLVLRVRYCDHAEREPSSGAQLMTSNWNGEDNGRNTHAWR